jgi:DNA-binding NarL/FixJ family response regulator
LGRPRVLLADDHRLVSEGLKRVLADDFDLVGLVEDGRALVAAAEKLEPDIVVADISMPRLNGIDALVQMRKHNPGIKVVFLTMHQEPAYARRALEAGAAGIAVKHCAPEELVMAIRVALKGQTFITPALASEVLRQARHELREGEEVTQLMTPRQREILELLAHGKSAKEIAAALAISARTIEFHKYQMMETHGL